MNDMIGPVVVILLLAGNACVDKKSTYLLKADGSAAHTVFLKNSAVEPGDAVVVPPTSEAEAKVQPLDALTVLQATATAVWCSLDRHRGGVSSPALCRTLGSRHKKDGTHKSQSPLFKELE